MASPHRIHVAVLDADIPCLSVYAKRGLYSSQFKKLLQNAASRLNTEQYLPTQLSVHVTAFDAVGSTLPDLETLRSTPRNLNTEEPAIPAAFTPIDAILISGSAASAYDPHPWIDELKTYIQIVHKNYPLVKIFGSCFGHQIIAQALLSAPIKTNDDQHEINAGLGLELKTDSAESSQSFHVKSSTKGFEMGIQPITLNKTFTANFPPLAKATSNGPFRIQLIHGDIVVPDGSASEDEKVTLPTPWLNIGHSASCQVQGLYLPGRILTYQGHFEFDAWLNAELCREFGRRANWEKSVVDGYVECMERSIVEGQDDDDDSKAAAEAVLIFFAGLDGIATTTASGIRAGAGVGAKLEGVQGSSITGMLTPPLE